MPTRRLQRKAVGVGNSVMTIDATGRHVVELLNGAILVVAGHRGARVDETDLYDCAARTFAATGDMNRGRNRSTITRLPDGRVLMVGGSEVNTPLISSEIYDPGTGLWTTTASMSVPAAARTAALLSNNRVLISGGFENSEYLGAELFDIATEQFVATTSGFRARGGHTATLLQDGRVLIAGGAFDASTTDEAELYDPATDTLTPTTPLPAP